MKTNLFSAENPPHLLCFPLLFVVNHFFAIVSPAYIHANNFWIWTLNFFLAFFFLSGCFAVNGAICSFWFKDAMVTPNFIYCIDFTLLLDSEDKKPSSLIESVYQYRIDFVDCLYFSDCSCVVRQI